MKSADRILPVAIFLATLTLYVRTLAPSLLVGDSAEFQTIAYTLGMGHPTGYPVYILIAKLFTFLPLGDIAYRVNLLSAVSAALTVSLAYLILRRLGAWHIPAALSVFGLAFGSVFWKQAAIAEVYTLSAAVLAFVLYSVLSWKESGNPRWLFVAGLFGGLSLGIHTTVALGGLAIFLYLLLSARKRTDWLAAVSGALAGVALFLAVFLFLDFINAPAGYYNTVIRPSLSVWGMSPADFDSPFERLAFLYFPPQFRGQFFAVPIEDVQLRLTDFFADLSWSGSIALAGIVSLLVPRKETPSRWREAILLASAFSTFLVFAATYDVYDYYVFYIPATLVLCIAVGLGFSALADVLLKFLPRSRVAVTALTAILIAADLWVSYPYVPSAWEERIPPMLESYEAVLFTSPEMRQFQAEQTLNRIEENAIVFTDWDKAYGFYYVAHVVQGRTEMDFHETYPQASVTQLADSALDYIEANIDLRPVYFTERPYELAALYKIERAGSGLFQILRK